MRKQRILAALLAFVMMLSLVPGMAFADEGNDTTVSAGADGYFTTSAPQDDMTLRKKVTLEDDGTYTINLEAWATGDPVYITVRNGLPSDIVLVLDQSGSMNYNDKGNSTTTESDRRYYKLKDALRSFVRLIQNNAKEYNVDHRISMIGFASGRTSNPAEINGWGITSGSNSTYWINTGLYIDGQMKPYAGQNNNSCTLTVQNYMDSLEYAYSNSGNYSDTTINNTDISNAITNMKSHGGTYTEYGLEMAQDVFDAIAAQDGTSYAKNGAYYYDETTQSYKQRQKIVVVFTDGETNSSKNTVLSYANELKEDGVIVYAISLLDNENDMLDQMSSNYSANSNKKTETKYYSNVTESGILESVFQNFSQEITAPGTNAAMDGTTELKDVLGADFTTTNETAVSIQYQAGSWNTGNTEIEWGAVTSATDGKIVDPSNSSSEITSSWSGNTLTVKGFDYCENHIGRNSTAAKDGHDGYKLMVEITGVVAKDSAVTGSAVYTNGDESGVYYTPEGGNTYSIAFGMPTTVLNTKSYVLDYAQTAALDMSDIQSAVKGIDSASDEILNKIGSSTVAASYGKLDYSEGSLSYTPTTTNWNGYDSFYVFGDTKTNAPDGTANDVLDNVWTKVSVLPANNVYYEDTFVDTTKATDKAGEVVASSVKIVYNGTNTTSSGNTEKAESQETSTGKGVHGWEDSLADDTMFSDGSATQMTAGATATFTFTGTGVDIYSYTDMTTGVVTAALAHKNGQTVTTQYLMVDNLAVSGPYYQIPTLSFSGLDYGEYTVTLIVNKTNSVVVDGNGNPVLEDGKLQYNVGDGLRSTYYLDGIRVYNPIQNLETTDTVQNAYGNTELNAVFTEVRDLMAKNGGSGITFIDLDEEGKTISKEYATTEYGTYGPKNEVYLAEGQSITFKVDNTGTNYQIGLKAPNGATTVAFSNDAAANSGTNIGHSTDLYYNVEPVNDMITIKNTGSELLSVTKIKTTGATPDASALNLVSITDEEALEEVAAFSMRGIILYSGPAVEEAPEEVTPIEPVAPDIDVDIKNPTVPEHKPIQKPIQNEALKKLVTSLFDKIFGWFGR